MVEGTMSDISKLSCGNYQCVYGVEVEGHATYGYCKCIPYPRFELTHHEKAMRTEKIKTAKWAMHHLRKQNKKLEEKIAHLEERLYGG
jgi:hypothetical protein